MRRAPLVRFCLASLVTVSGLACPAIAAAQGVGLGPRLSFVRGDIESDTPSRSFVGGVLRTMSSAHIGFEFSIDYRSQLSDDHATRLRETPFQTSILIYPSRHRLAPYLLGGYGIYTDTTDVLAANGLVTSSTTSRRSGVHLGFGAEYFANRHTSLFADYRFRFVKFGSDSTATSGLQVSHEGSMWTTGVVFHF